MPTTVTGLTEWQARLRALPTALQDVVTAVLEAWAPRLEQWMQANAPWQDTVGPRPPDEPEHARAALHAYVVPSSRTIWLIAAHGVRYGVYLEKMQQGRFAILWPAIRVFWPQIQAALVAKLQATFGGRWRVAA